MEFQDTDSILAELESEQQSQEPIKEPQESSPTVTPEVKPDSPFVQINYRGQSIPLTQSQAIDFAQKGKDYETKMSDFKKLKEEFEGKTSKFQKWEDRYSRMEEIDNYYREHPDKLQYLLEQYDKVKDPAYTGETGDPALTQKISALEKTIEDLKGGYKAFEEERQASFEQRVQSEVFNSFGKMKEAHPYLKWDATDQDGLKLEDFILKYATDNNIQNIETATLEYCKDQIFENIREQAKKEAIDSLKEGNKKGVVSVSTSPKSPKTPARTDTSKSFEDLAKEAIAELEAGIYP